MQVIPQIVKDKPGLSVATFTGIVAVFSGVFVFEDRYVNAADFQQYEQQQQKAFEGLEQQQQKSLNQLYHQIVEDELFALELKKAEGKASSIDEARIQHLKRRLRLND